MPPASPTKRKGQPYMREHSTVIRVLSSGSYKSLRDDTVMTCPDKL
jgi:hypothetical protein